MRISIIAVAFTVALLLSWKGEAAEICDQPIQVGCYALHVRVVKYDPNNELLKALVEGQVESADVAGEIFKAVDEGKIILYTGPVDLRAYFWGVNSGVADTTMASYDRNDLRQRVVPVWESSPFSSNRGYPQKVYAVNVSGGKGVLYQAPWDFFGDNPYILLCFSGKAQPLYPRQHAEFGRFPSLDLTTPFLNMTRRKKFDGSRLIVVMQ